MRTATPPAVAVVAWCLVLVTACGANGGTQDSNAARSDAVSSAASDQALTLEASPPDEVLDDPCRFLEASDLEIATGISFGPPVSDLGNSTCRWESNDPNGFVEIIVIRGTDAYGVNRTEAEAAFADLEPIEVPGADDAYSADQGRILGLDLKDDFLEVRVELDDLQHVIDRARQIAGIALTKL